MATTKRAMKMSKLYAPTLKEDPAEAELASHRLLLRAGMIRKEAAGLDCIPNLLNQHLSSPCLASYS